MQLTIITVVKNDLTGLKKTYDSLISQRFKDFEWIVVDGVSTDGTTEYVKSLPKFEGIIISENDSGIFDAMNKGLLLSSGDFVVFLNAGDYFTDDNVLFDVMTTLDLGDGIDLIYGDSSEVHEDGKIYLKNARSYLNIYYGMFACHQSMFYRTSIAINVLFNVQFRIAGDYDFTSRFLKKTQNVKYIERSLCVFDLNGVSRKNELQGRRENWRVQREVIGLSIFKCLCIRACYLLSHFCRNRLGSVYLKFRYKGC
jgi:putative colanic acid biosynthesis glycosyltransferase